MSGGISGPIRRSASVRRLVAIGVTLIVLLSPFLWLLQMSFKSNDLILQFPPPLIFTPTLQNYASLWQGAFPASFVNSLMSASFSTALALLLGVPAAYALSRWAGRGKHALSFAILVTRMAPPIAFTIPFFLFYRWIGLLDTVTGLVLVYTSFNLPLVIWMMRSFFAEFPREIIEASQIDGASFVRSMVAVILPLAVPGLAATGLLCIIFAWNEFFLAVNLTGPGAGPLTVYISGFMTSEGLFWAKMSAASTVAIAPVFIAGWAAQRALVRGLTMGAVK